MASVIDELESGRLVINPIWNAYYFFTLYANADGEPVVGARVIIAPEGRQLAWMARESLDRLRQSEYGGRAATGSRPVSRQNHLFPQPRSRFIHAIYVSGRGAEPQQGVDM